MTPKDIERARTLLDSLRKQLGQLEAVKAGKLSSRWSAQVLHNGTFHQLTFSDADGDGLLMMYQNRLRLKISNTRAALRKLGVTLEEPNA